MEANKFNMSNGLGYYLVIEDRLRMQSVLNFLSGLSNYKDHNKFPCVRPRSSAASPTGQFSLVWFIGGIVSYVF